MNKYCVEERQISFGDLVLNVLFHWKIVLVCAIIFMILGGVYSWYKETHTDVDEEEVEQTQEEVVRDKLSDYEKTEENIYETIYDYETAISDERNYLNNSVYMQLDPYHVVNTMQEFELKAVGETDLNQLLMIGRRLNHYATSSEILSELSEKYDLKNEYLLEVLSSGLRDNQYDPVTEVSVTNSESSPVFMDNGNQKYFYFYVNVRGSDKTFTEAVCNEVSEYIVSKKSVFDKYSFELTPLSAITAERVDTNAITDQNAARARIYDYSDKLTKFNTILSTVEKMKAEAEEEAEEEEAEVAARLNIKNLALGFIGGIVLAAMLLMLRSVFSNKFKTEKEFRSRYTLNNLGTAPSYIGNKQLKGIQKRIWNKLEGSSSTLSDEMFYEMTGLNIANRLSDMGRILLTGTIEKSDLSELSERLLPILKKNCEKTEFVFSTDLIGNPDTRKLLQEIDGVILVEKRGYTINRFVEDELRILSESDKEVLGAILL